MELQQITYMSFNKMWFNVLLEHWKYSHHNFILGYEAPNPLFVSLNPRNQMWMHPTNLFYNVGIIFQLVTSTWKVIDHKSEWGLNWADSYYTYNSNPQVKMLSDVRMQCVDTFKNYLANTQANSLEMSVIETKAIISSCIFNAIQNSILRHLSLRKNVFTTREKKINKWTCLCNRKLWQCNSTHTTAQSSDTSSSLRPLREPVSKSNTGTFVLLLCFTSSMFCNCQNDKSLCKAGKKILQSSDVISITHMHPGNISI